jgi:peptidoglycan-associated lipoprotein
MGISNGVNDSFANHSPREVTMSKKSLIVTILILCIALIMTGCPKKTVMKEEPSVKKEEAVRPEAERKAKESKAQEELEKSMIAKKTPGVEGEVFESSLLKDIHFDYEKYDIRPGDVAIQKGNADLLKKYHNVKIQIEGHCDERGTVEYNLALGERRANSTRNYLVSIGVSPERISTISYGKERPLDPAHNEEAWAKNRRAHTIITAK